MSRRYAPAVAAAFAAAFAATLIGVALAWHGPTQFLDAASYASAIRSIGSGHWFTSTLAPSFSQFGAAEFLRRGGRIPFVDFPLGYPVVAAVLEPLVGATRAMMVVATVSAGATAGLVAAPPAGPRGASGPARRVAPWLLAAGAVGVTLLPIFQAVVRAGLSEPLFCALAVWCVREIVVAGREPRRWRWAFVAAGAASTVRFVGLPLVGLVVLAAWRGGDRRTTLRRAAIALVVPVANLAWASIAGSGHRLGPRAVHLVDAKLAVHASGGWWFNRFGGFGLIFVRGWSPPWWLWVVAGAWVVLVCWCVVDLLRIHRLPTVLTVPLTAAGLLAAGVLAAMVSFDSLVAPDNRLLLPSGVLTLTGLAWWAYARLDGRWFMVTVVAWSALAVAPWRLRPMPAQPTDAMLRAATSGVRVVVSDDADRVWWQTGVASAYLPGPVELLTGRAVDQRAELDLLPCLLSQHGGAIVLVGGPFVDTSLRAALDGMVEAGLFDRRDFGDVERLDPSARACATSPGAG